jgi:hypothetical protein
MGFARDALETPTRLRGRDLPGRKASFGEAERTLRRRPRLAVAAATRRRRKPSTSRGALISVATLSGAPRRSRRRSDPSRSRALADLEPTCFPARDLRFSLMRAESAWPRSSCSANPPPKRKKRRSRNVPEGVERVSSARAIPKSWPRVGAARATAICGPGTCARGGGGCSRARSAAIGISTSAGRRRARAGCCSRAASSARARRVRAGLERASSARARMLRARLRRAIRVLASASARGARPRAPPEFYQIA